MRLIPCSSRAIAAFGYENGVLVIAFRGGGTYRYSGVPLQVAQALGRAPSKGRYYAGYIKGRYPAVRIR